MQIKIETKTTQTIDGKKEIINQTGTGNIKNYEKGIILSWNVPEENISFQMTILENKILLKNENQNMIFELGKTTKSILQTQYGNLSMYITTKYMDITKENKMLKKIDLVYDIKIDDVEPYENKIEINIK